MSTNQPTPPPPSLADDPDWDQVDQAAWESFPASDPPSFGSSRAAPSKAAVDDTCDQVTRQLAADRRRTRIRTALRYGLPVLGALVLFKLGRLSR
jgi:hypothetical protein